LFQVHWLERGNKKLFESCFKQFVLMIGKTARVIMLFTVVAVASVASIGMFLQNASGDFLEILRIGKSGVKLAALAFVPMSAYLLYKAV